MDPKARQAQQARTLVTISHILGWGGLGLLLVGAPAMLIAIGSPPGAAWVGGGGLVLAIAGGIVGTVGRALQGRVL